MPAVPSCTELAAYLTIKGGNVQPRITEMKMDARMSVKTTDRFEASAKIRRLLSGVTTFSTHRKKSVSNISNNIASFLPLSMKYNVNVNALTANII
jgi:hypothetical protein